MFSQKGGSVYQQSNDKLLKLVLSGTGGFVKIDTSCKECTRDTSGFVEFPSYTPLVNSGGILSFASMNDYNSFIMAADLMENLWKYPDTDYEDTPLEIYHLGEESLNAFDSALGFQSLRNKYEANDFYNSDWKDTASIIVEDDDRQMVLNELCEVKIGNKYYKYVSDYMIAEINDNINTLDSVRIFGVLTPGRNLRFFDENEGVFTKPQWTEITQGCADFNLALSANLSSRVNSSSYRWGINTSVLNPLTGSHPNRYTNVRASYTIDWGDGSTENFIGYFGSVNFFYHIYQYPTTGYIGRNVTVSCQIIQQSNPSPGYTDLIQNCTNLTNIVFTSTATIILNSENYPDCLKGRIVRQFSGIEKYIGGTKYRVDCKLKQVGTQDGVIFNWQSPKIGATIVFQKLKNNKWKKTKSIGQLILNLRGNVNTSSNCSILFYTINETRTKNKAQKIKLNILGNLNTYVYFPIDIRTLKQLPFAINADYIWKYNNNQSITGNFSEILKP